MFGQRVLDGRRGRKQPKRKCVDFNTPLLRHLHQRVLVRDYRDLPDLQPSVVSPHLGCTVACPPSVLCRRETERTAHTDSAVQSQAFDKQLRPATACGDNPARYVRNEPFPVAARSLSHLT